MSDFSGHCFGARYFYISRVFVSERDFLLSLLDFDLILNLNLNLDLNLNFLFFFDIGPLSHSGEGTAVNLSFR